ncbi:MAG TPA: TlpA disulfide reductase family protein [Candidatus Acidoferrales bacterium]|nr:TlpA disulfide reductase family protein [Candidatus Acidoferrales bacterium]
MNRVARTLLPAVVLLVVATGFLGCKGVVSKGGSGQPATLANEPDVKFTDLQGNNVALASMKGKVVLVNFWATWCEPCRGEIPILIGMQNQYASKGFTTLGVAMDEEGKKVVDPFVQTEQFNVSGHPTTMNYPIVLGSDDIATQFGGLLGMPTSYLISRDGKIAKKYVGALVESQVVKDVESQL